MFRDNQYRSKWMKTHSKLLQKKCPGRPLGFVCLLGLRVVLVGPLLLFTLGTVAVQPLVNAVNHHVHAHSCPKRWRIGWWWLIRGDGAEHKARSGQLARSALAQLGHAAV